MLCGHQVPYSVTWPTSVSMRRGRLYLRPASGHRTGASVSSSLRGLLPTPNATDSQGGPRAIPEKRTSRGKDHGPRLRDMAPALLPTPNSADAWVGDLEISPESVERQLRRNDADGTRRTTTGSLAKDLLLLKTPTAQLAVNGGSQHPDKRRDGGHGPTLADQIEHELLPTPRATDGTKGGRDLMLPSAVMGLLPTPTSRDHKGPNQRQDASCLHGALLPTPLSADGGLGRGSSAGFGLRNVSREIARGDHLLPTPRCADGMVASNMQSNRDRLEGGARRRSTLEEEISLMPGESNGDLTGRPLPGGNPSSGDQHPGQLSLGEPESG